MALLYRRAGLGEGFHFGKRLVGEEEHFGLLVYVVCWVKPCGQRLRCAMPKRDNLQRAWVRQIVIENVYARCLSPLALAA